MRDSNSKISNPWYSPLFLLAAVVIGICAIANALRSDPELLTVQAPVDETGFAEPDSSFEPPILGLSEEFSHGLSNALGVQAESTDELASDEPSLGAASQLEQAETEELSIGDLAMIDDSATFDSAEPVSGSLLVQRTVAFPTSGSGYNWRGLFDVVDSRLWRRSYAPAQPANGTGLSGIGFPHLHVEGAPKRFSNDSYKRMVSWHDLDGNGRNEPIAHVKCMGLSPIAVANRAKRYNPMIKSLAHQHRVSVNLVKAVIAAESCYDENAVSRVGALGLMQLMPATAEWLKAGDPLLPEENLKAGIRYLALLNERFPDRRLVLAAYNAGPGKVRRYGGIPPYRETRNYVKRVMAHYRRYTVAARLGGS